MNLTDALIPPGWDGLWLVLLLVVGYAVWTAPWQVLKKDGVLNLMLGASLFVLAWWQIHAGIRPGQNLHLLGATLLTLLFGPRFALLCILLALGVHTAWFGNAWHAFPANALLSGAVPVSVSWLVYTLADRYLPNNLFVYIFANGFFASAVSVAVAGLAASGLMAAMGDYAWKNLLSDYLPYFLLIGWSEAVSTGMLITVLVVYKPHWVATFSDAAYIHGR